MEFLFSKAAGVDGIFPNITTSYTSLITAPSKERNVHCNGALVNCLSKFIRFT